MKNEPKVYTKADAELLRQTVAKDATDAELRLFIEMCKATGLNPFKREIWFIKVKDQVQMMTGINGFYQIANSYEQYDGIETGLISKEGEYLSLAYPGTDFIGAWARVHRKDRKIPTEGVAMLAEYDKGYGNWRTMKRTMITKCAEAVALRKAIAQKLAAVYVHEEIESDEAKEERKEALREELKAKAEEAKKPLMALPAGETRTYAIPFSATQARQKLATMGFSVDKTEKPWHWTGMYEIEELAQYLVAPKDEPTPVYPPELVDIEVNWEE